MVKNKLEKLFSKSAKADDDLWCIKLHNNPLAHQNTPADYIVSCEINCALHLHLVECKQVTCKEGKGRLAFKRLKQMHDLLAFQLRMVTHYSWFCVAFLDNTVLNSEIYLIPVKVMDAVIYHADKVSINREEANDAFDGYQLSIESGSILNLKALKQV